VEERGHRRAKSDPRTFNREALAQMVAQTTGELSDSGFTSMDTDSEPNTPQVEFVEPKATEPLSATLNISSNDRPEGHRHRRTKSDSSYLKVFPSAEGYRLVIPPQALKSLKDVDPQDQSVTVFLSRDPAMDGTDARFRGDFGKSSTRPKHYKCSKCGQPKKGHVCEFGNEKSVPRPNMSPRELGHSVSPHMEQLSFPSHQGMLLHSDHLQHNSLGQSSLMRDFESNRYNSHYAESFPAPPPGMLLSSLLMQQRPMMPPATIFDSMNDLNHQDVLPPHTFEMDDVCDQDLMQVSETHNPMNDLPFKMDSLEGMFYNDLDADPQDVIHQ
jgi:hypothetical protein